MPALARARRRRLSIPDELSGVRVKAVVGGHDQVTDAVEQAVDPSHDLAMMFRLPEPRKAERKPSGDWRACAA